MARSSCPACGATVDVAQIKGTNDTVPLEIHTDAATDAPRYRIVNFQPLVCERVAVHASGDYTPDHRYDCPGHGAGRG